MSKKPIIEHDRYERPRKRGDLRAMWITGFIILAALWTWYLLTHAPNWLAVGLGAMSGLMIMAWAADTWGDKPYSELTKILPEDEAEKDR